MLPDRKLPQGYIAAHNLATDSELEQTRTKLRPDAMVVEMTAEYERYIQNATMAHSMPVDAGWQAKKGVGS